MGRETKWKDAIEMREVTASGEYLHELVQETLEKNRNLNAVVHCRLNVR